MNATSSPQTPVARIDPGLMKLSDLLQKAKQQIALALPKHLTAERMIRMAMTLYGKNEQLKKCDPLTILACVIQSSELGLELSSPLGHAFMVPYGTTATFQIGYKGFFELAFRSGRVSAFPMRTVYQNDNFKVRYGTDQKIIHEPAMKNRGDVIGYYAALYLKDGGRDFEWMSVEDITEHRKKYVKNKRTDSPWNTAEGPMAMKTCVRMLSKRIPVSTELNLAVSIDEQQEAGMQLDVDLGPLSRQANVAAALQGNGNGSDEGVHIDPPANGEQGESVPLDTLRERVEVECGIKGIAIRKAFADAGIASKPAGDWTPDDCTKVLAWLAKQPGREPGADDGE